jgi:hypothetical protein
MLPRLPSVHQSPTGLPATPLGVGIDTSRYGHYAAFLDANLETAAPDLEVVESAAGYGQLRQRLADLVARHGPVHFHVRLDAAGLYADNLLAWLGAVDLAARLGADSVDHSLSSIPGPVGCSPENNRGISGSTGTEHTA